jgi:hypothetical protein
MTESPTLSYAEKPSDRQHRALGGILWAVLGVLFLVLILQINRRITSGHSGDFRHFYFAAGALLDHRDLYGPVPLDVVERALGRPAGVVEKRWYTTDSERYLYPPLIALLYTPIARVQFETAQRVMLIVNALLVLIGIIFTTRGFIDRFELPRTGWQLGAIALLGTILNFDKVHVELQMFQTNALMFAMFALSLYWLDRRPILAGIPLGVILNIKYLSLALVPWLLIRRRWGSAASCMLSTVAFALLPAIISGWGTNLKNLSVAYGGLLHMVGVHCGAEQANVDDIRDFLSCSITSALARTTERGQSLTLPMIAVGCIAGLAVCIVMWTYMQERIPVFEWPSAGAQTRQPFKAMLGVEFVSIIAATLCFSPQTNTRHLMLALLLTIPLAALILAGRNGSMRIVATTAALLIGIGFIFPPGGQAPASHKLAMHWFGVGGQCWCLLLAMFLLVGGGAARGIYRLPHGFPVRQ